MTLFQKTLLASALLASLTAPGFAQVQQVENCSERFAAADSNNDGSLGDSEAKPFYERKWGSNSSNTSNIPIISRQEFLQDCGKGNY
jgi:Ca2+-binding EF-hand superfamily protein